MLLAGEFSSSSKVLELIWALDRKLTGESLQVDKSDLLPRGSSVERLKNPVENEAATNPGFFLLAIVLFWGYVDMFGVRSCQLMFASKYLLIAVSMSIAIRFPCRPKLNGG